MVLVARSVSYRGKIYRLRFKFSLPAAQRWKPRCSALPLTVSFLLLPIGGTSSKQFVFTLFRGQKFKDFLRTFQEFASFPTNVTSTSSS